VRRSVAALAFLLASISAAASAIVIRADVPDARYRELGEKYRDIVAEFPILQKEGTLKRATGTGTLIAPQWVITAGHVGVEAKADLMTAAKNGDRFSIYIAGKPYPLEQVYFHPRGGTGVGSMPLW
jgi:hypothetical protein